MRASFPTLAVVSHQPQTTNTNTMTPPIVIIGMGEMGGVFARAFLRSGHPVYPVTRAVSMPALAEQVPDPALVLLAVAENAVTDLMAELPAAWRSKLALLQNELLPGDWQGRGYTDPTVISVWFEKKKGQDAKVLIPSPAFGPQAGLLVEALGSIDIAARTVDSPAAMEQELVIKNVYILTTNIAGLECGGTVASLWKEHRELAEAVAGEVIQLQAALVGHELAPQPLLEGMATAFAGDWDHKCMGRSAPARLRRALDLAARQGLRLAKLQRIADRHLQD